MFYSSSKHLFDIMFVIACVVAGATSQHISNGSKTSPIHQLHNRYKTSFIDFILDDSLIELLRPSNFLYKPARTQSKHSLADLNPSDVEKIQLQSHNVCTQLSNILSVSQVRFCHKHQDLLEAILPRAVQLTREECARVTSNLRWNCTTLEPFLDRSSSLAFTKEAALVRSIMNASMMYLIVKICSEHTQYSCGCQAYQEYSEAFDPSAKTSDYAESISAEQSSTNSPHNSTVDHVSLSPLDLVVLNSGAPIQLTKALVHRQDCFVSVAFANAFTKVFLDADDTKSLNKAFKILNEDHNNNNHNNYQKMSNKHSTERRKVDSDYKDLSFIKWTKSAINLHNNHVGRQLVREAAQKQCRCHGLSGVCHFRTCWNHLQAFETIASRLRSIYLSNSIKAETRNIGSYERPDLYLARSASSLVTSKTHDEVEYASRGLDRRSLLAASLFGYTDRIRPGELLYIYESSDYCEPNPRIKHYGTKGRQCDPRNSMSKQTVLPIEHTSLEAKPISEDVSQEGATGSCEQLCCGRGHHSELAMGMVSCNCRFRFCCSIVCEHCLRQRLQHFCL